MDTEHDLAHGRAAPRAPSASDDDLAPGRSTRSSQLAAPAHPIAGGLLRKPRDGNGVADDAEHAVAAAGSSPGHALPAPVLRKFESSLGADLSSVRVHTGAASQTAAASVGARAYTVGQDIHFGAGQYDPTSRAGEHLLAHEVAHTVQQAGGAPGRQYKLEVSAPGDALETEADRAADAIVSGQPAQMSGASTGVGRKIMRSPDGGGEVSVKAARDLDLQTVKLPKQSFGYFEATSEIKLKVETTAEATKPRQAESPPGEAGEGQKAEHAESEVTVKPDELEAEVKKKFINFGSGVSLQGSLGDSINWKERKFELGAGLKVVAEGDEFASEAGAKFVPFTIDDSGVHIGELEFSGSGSPKNSASISIAGTTFSCKPVLSWKAAVELNKEKVGEELFKRLAERFGTAAAGEALIPVSMIAAGALTVFMYFDTVLAADDIQKLVDAGPSAVVKARQFIDQVTRDIQSGNGPAVQQLAQNLGKDFGGAIPPAMLAKVLKENVTPEQLTAKLWPPMRQQIIDRSVASYRSKHKVESTFKDMGTWIGEKLGDKDDHSSTYGEDILYRTLDEILPTTL